MQKILPELQKILKPTQILTSKTTLLPYNTSWLPQYHGNSPLALLPLTTTQTSQILKTCNNHSQPLITTSGRTSLVGGTTSKNSEILLSLEKLNKFTFDNKTGILKTESGAILQDIQDFLAKHGYETPFDLGARGSCMIGGNVATNAGGVNFVKYGSLRNYVLGLEIVLASGEVLDLMQNVQKDNTGIDLKQLFIGSEGILGVITKVNLLCKPVLSMNKVFLLRVKGFNNIVELVKTSKTIFGGSLKAVEYIDYECFFISSSANNDFFFELDNLEDYYNKKLADDEKDHFLLVEIEGNDEDFLDSLLEKFLDKTENRIYDSILADDKTKQEKIWSCRENITMNLSNYGKILKYDLSIKYDLFENIINSVRKKFHNKILLATGYGHIGDGNIHFQVIFKKDVIIQQELKNEIDEFVYDFVKKCKGSISAEHGIGLLKVEYLEKQKSDVYLKYAVEIKKLFDSNNILNRGKTLKIK